MALKKYQFPGLTNPVYLPDWITVEIKLITHPRFRSFRKSSDHVKTTWHDTGNPNTNADAEYRWANAGREGAGVGGYNGIFDSKKIIITQPFDEVIWAAGTEVGNRTSYHFEMAYGGGQDYNKVLEVGYALHGAICAAKGWSVDTSLVKHQYWYGKWCPATILNKGLWSEVVAEVTTAAELARQAGAGSSGPAPSPQKIEAPSIIPELDKISKAGGFAPAFLKVGDVVWVWVGDRVKTIRPTGRYKYGSKDSPRVGEDFKEGEDFDVDWIAAGAEVPVYNTPAGTRVIVADTTRASDVKGPLTIPAE